MRSQLNAALLVVVLAAGACAQPVAPPPAPAKPDLAAEEQAIRAVDATWMKTAQARDIAAEVALLAPEAIIVRQNEPPMNVAAFQVYGAKSYADNPKMTTTWTTEMIRVNDSGDWAVQTGNYSNAALGPKGTGADAGRFVTIWKKVNGTWKPTLDTSVSTTPAAKK